MNRLKLNDAASSFIKHLVYYLLRFLQILHLLVPDPLLQQIKVVKSHRVVYLLLLQPAKKERPQILVHV